MRPWQINLGSWQEAHEALFLHGESLRGRNVTRDSVPRALIYLSSFAPVQHVYRDACDTIQLR